MPADASSNIGNSDGRSVAGVPDFPRFDVRGIEVSAIDIPFARDFIGQRAKVARGDYVTVTGAHGIVESVHNPQVLEAHQAALMAVPDGMPLVWLGRLLGFKTMDRVYGPDLMRSIFANEEYRGLRHFFYGSQPSAITALTNTIVSQFGEFNLVGSYSPPMKPLGYAEDENVLAHIRDLKPHLIWVGLSTPKQELWMQRHMPMIGSGIGIGVGAAFDLVSGRIPHAPLWMQRSGLEWLFRLGAEPKRLFRRYAFIVPRFLCILLGTLIKGGTRRRGT